MPANRRLPVVADLTLVTAGAMIANVAGYLLQVLAGRWLGVAGYSEFASLLAVQLLCAVPALALQNVVAREWVRGAGAEALRRLRLRCAVIVAVVVAALIPVVTSALHVGVAACAAALGAAPALVLLSGEQGILQGARRFRGLALVLGTAGVARVAPALVVLAIGGGAAAALCAAAVGLVAAAIFARCVAGSPETADYTKPAGHSEAADRPEAAGRPEVAGDPGAGRSEAVSRSMAARPGAARRSNTSGDSEKADQPRTADLPHKRTVGVLPVLRAAQVQAALMALSSADLIVVRMVLDEADASRYALGTIATKIAFWLPQAVGVVLYPRMAQPAHSARAIRDALGVLSVIGVVAVIVAAVAAPLAPLFVGRDYAPIQGLLWLFALHGAILAVLQGVMLSAIAVDRTALAALTWLGLVVEVTGMLLFARTVPALIVTAVSVAAVTTVIVAVVVLRTADRPWPLLSTGSGLGRRQPRSTAR